MACCDMKLFRAGAVQEMRAYCYRKRKIERSQEALLENIEDGEKYGMSSWRTFRDVKCLKASG